MTNLIEANAIEIRNVNSAGIAYGEWLPGDSEHVSRSLVSDILDIMADTDADVVWVDVAGIEAPARKVEGFVARKI